MPKINVIKPFAFAHRGCDVEQFAAGTVDTTDEVADLAVAEGWAERRNEPVVPAVAPIAQANGELAVADFTDTQPAQTAALPAAPETADAAPKQRKR